MCRVREVLLARASLQLCPCRPLSRMLLKALQTTSREKTEVHWGRVYTYIHIGQDCLPVLLNSGFEFWRHIIIERHVFYSCRTLGDSRILDDTVSNPVDTK